MGCLCSKPQPNYINNSPMKSDQKGYSWENKETMNPKDYTIEDVKETTIVKLPGSVKGQQFIIQNCENSNIYILDHINTAVVDDCHNCKIFLGPTKGSVFIRDCHECCFLIASQQFRARDCKFVSVYLCCPTQPIIESCSDMQFGCFSFYYDQLEDHFQKAGLNIFNNNWSNIHDFTPAEDEQNWNFLPKGFSAANSFVIPNDGILNGIEVKIDPSHSIVPQTFGYHQKISHQSCLVVFFPDGQSQKRCMSFIREMEHQNIVLVRTKHLKLNATDALRIFSMDAYNSIVEKGPIVALEYNGDNCITCCETVAKAITTETGCTGLVYISSNAKMVNKQLENLFSYSTVHMSV